MASSDLKANNDDDVKISPDQYFKETTVPTGIEEVKERFVRFVEKQQAEGRQVVVVTCGGTVIPLEKNTVRFLDNFSTGSRGAACTENFVEMGYAVIFLYRTGCVQPYARHVQAATSQYVDGEFIDKLSINEDRVVLSVGEGGVIGDALRKSLSPACRLRRHQLLLSVPFRTIDDYLFMLRAVSSAVLPLGRHAMFVLAAAVSDFYVPESELAEHKIQSRGGALELTMRQVPKLLPELRKWCPDAFCVSFKLETDHELLLPKARAAARNYKMNVVVANQLHLRYKQVLLVSETECEEVKKQGTTEIEALLCEGLAQRHLDYILTAPYPLPPASPALSTSPVASGLREVGRAIADTCSGVLFPFSSASPKSAVLVANTVAATAVVAVGLMVVGSLAQLRR